MPRPITKLPKLRDLDSRSLSALRFVADACDAEFAARGYTALETPIIEETELFLRKSGGEIASRLYSFTDPGGFSVSLRPEYTAPVIRYLLTEADLDTLPARYSYFGPVFRYPNPEIGASGEPGVFVQSGVELVGGPAPLGDGEILSTAFAVLQRLQLPAPKIALGHVGLIWDILAPFNLSERARLFLVNSLGSLAAGDLASVSARAAEVGLLPRDKPTEGATGAPSDTEGGSHEIVESVLGYAFGNSFGGLTGSRTAREIVERLAQKMETADDPAAFENALELLGQLARVKGEPGAALDQGRVLIERLGRSSAPFEALEAVIESAVDQGVPETALTVDLGLGRGLAYYTGAVFELSCAGGHALGGGGRYDGLLRALGSDREAPALGFAFNVDAMIEALSQIPPSTAEAGAVLIVPDSADAGRASGRLAARLRSEGRTAVLDFAMRDSEDLRRYGRSVGATEVRHVSASGMVRQEAL